VSGQIDEISLLRANCGQPLHDRDPIKGTTKDNLAADEVERLLVRLREREPRVFDNVTEVEALRRVGVLVASKAGGLVPSLAGLLTLGTYPQEFFPQLNVTFVVFPAASRSEVPSTGPRFIDNQNINGSIPVMVTETVKAIIRNMARRSDISGLGRQDSYDYPVESLREVITNALMHRDYGAGARGTQVQVEMYSDRITVRSPGGLFGAVTTDELGEGASSSRNGYLARLLQDVTIPGTDLAVCENRGSGIAAILATFRREEIAPPIFSSRLTRFSVTLPRTALLDPTAQMWLRQLNVDPLTHAQASALVLMRNNGGTTARQLAHVGIPLAEARQVLHGLASRGLAIIGTERGREKFILNADLNPLTVAESSVWEKPLLLHQLSPRRESRSDEIEALFRVGGSLRSSDVASATGLKPAMVARYLKRLVESGRIIAVGATTSRNRTYRKA
jgi:ATP-dependent DNA helicase RecG